MNNDAVLNPSMSSTPKMRIYRKAPIGIGYTPVFASCLLAQNEIRSHWRYKAMTTDTFQRGDKDETRWTALSDMLTSNRLKILDTG
jgi:hypothetical protein